MPPAQTLWMELPLTDAEVIEQFTHLRPLNAAGAAGRPGSVFLAAADPGRVRVPVCELRQRPNAV